MTASPITQQHSSRIGLAHISLVFVGLMCILPFLYYVHDHPITTFYQEWAAVVLGLCAMPLLVMRRFWQQPEIPRIILLPAGLILIVMLQSALGKVAYFGQALLFALYMLWSMLLIMLGQRLREQLGLPALAAALAMFLLLGAELSALIGVLQHYRWQTFLDPVIVIKTGTAIFGNMAQPNHFAHYITLGLISLGLLRTHWRMHMLPVASLAAPLLFVLVLSGSRSSWLYLLCLTGMAFLWQRRERKGGCDATGLRQDRPKDECLAAHPLRTDPPVYPLPVDKPCLPLLHYCLALLLGFGLMHLVVQIPVLAAGSAAGGATGGGSVTAAERLIGQAGGDSIRLYLWHEAWLIFTQFPLLGTGFGQFAWQHFQLGPVLHDANIMGLYNNAHNLVMHIAAEMGLSGLLILLVTLGLWLRQARGAQRTIYHWWGYGLLAVMAVHSMLEYILWYSYFLGVAAITLGIFDTTAYRFALRRMGRLSIAAILFAGTLFMAQLWQGYRDLEGMKTMLAAGKGYHSHVSENLAALHKQSILQPYAELYMSTMIEISPDNLAAKRSLNENVMHFVPIGPVVYRDALLLALSGEQAAAQLQMERAIWSYPDGFPRASGQLRALAREDSAHFATLLEFALQKYEERQRAAIFMG